ncbi:MAG: stage II sporulation protein P [Ruminococcus sp.]|nr:stage II sporulation protein P [Ruminococcus sp.]
MRKRLSRRAAARRKKRIIALTGALGIALMICIMANGNLSEKKYNKDNPQNSDDILSNVCNEVYVDLKRDRWNPLSDEALEANTDSLPNKSAEEKNNDKTSNGDKPYPEKWNVSDDTEIIRTSLSGYSGDKFFSLANGGQVANHTSISNSDLLAESVLKPAFKISVNEKPQVLIMHTHTTETYEPYIRSSFDPSFNYRTTDSSRNVVAVGEAIAEKLRAAGIVTLHDETIHDYPSYTGAYERSAETVSNILEENPSIKVVLDIHRDAIGTESSITQPIADINGKESAQVMIISGCDDGTMDMPNYMFNFRFACRLQERMESMYPGLTRPVLFDYRRYNQDLTTGSLLIEVGSHGNTFEQAVYAGSLLGDALAKVLLDLH